MKALVTGAAGFIGSHLCKQLREDGWNVVGIDALTDYYDRNLKRANLCRAGVICQLGIPLQEMNLLDVALKDVTHVFHLAGQPGVRRSWGRDFGPYVEHNITATQALLEACAGRSIERFVYASTSAVYGQQERFPFQECMTPHPVSPYGVTKLAGEHLCELYRRAHGVPTVTVRYFTVYGPGQRPDMAFHKFFRAAMLGQPIDLFGDGSPTRDFTYVTDAVDGTIRAALHGTPGAIYNLAGGARVSMREAVNALGTIAGRGLTVTTGQQLGAGEMLDTSADIRRAREALGYWPRVGLGEGLAAQWAWMQETYAGAPEEARQ